eukprot:g15171.t1
MQVMTRKLKSKQEALTPEDPVLGATDAEADAAGAFDPSAGTAQLRRKRKRRPSATAERLSEGTATARSEMTEEARVDTKHDPGTLLPLGATKTLPGGVVIKVLRAAPFGAPVALKGSEVRLIYEGRLAKNQRRFDNGEIDFLLGDGTMLPGFVQGVTGMGVGERRLIQIPWKLGYGKKGKKPKIPPMSDLDFDASLTFCGIDWKERSKKRCPTSAGRQRSAVAKSPEQPDVEKEKQCDCACDSFSAAANHGLDCKVSTAARLAPFCFSSAFVVSATPRMALCNHFPERVRILIDSLLFRRPSG